MDLPETQNTTASPEAPPTLCLDFTNTVDWRLRAQPEEGLTSYADLVAWSQGAGLLTAEEAQSLRDLAAAEPTAAAAALAEALALREAIYRIFAAGAGDAVAAEGDLARLNDALADALARLEIVPTAAGFAWAWRSAPDSLTPMLWPVVRSAGDLLTSPRLDRVRLCAGEDCGWLFLDTSRNGSRRWCSMEGCGNRAKARRHYQRKRGE